MRRIATVLILLSAFTILGVTLFYAYKHQPVEENEPTSEVQVGVVNEREENAISQEQGGYVDPYGYQETIPENEIQAYIIEVFGESADWALRVAFCESTFNPNVSNGVYSGLFQFHPSTFKSTPIGQAGYSIWDWKAQVRATHWMYEQGRKDEWGCK